MSMKKHLMSALVAGGLPLAAHTAAADDLPPPPYLMTGANTVTIALQWDADSVAPLLPESLTVADDLSGGINVYYVDAAVGLSAYSSAYAYINVKDPEAEGALARHILGGWYGPEPKVSAAMKTYFGAPVAPGSSNQMAEGETWVGEGGDGDGMIRIVIEPSEDCSATGGVLNYLDGDMKRMVIPFTGSFCAGTPVSVDISGPEGSALAQVKVSKMLGGGQLKGGTFAFTR